ncbi:MAG: hypothetical protein LC107_04075, partial [Chitinophagales bacterium]|nr:hypothetical protein [Chitinophagales bacterium]
RKSTETRTAKGLVMEVEDKPFDEGALILVPVRSKQAKDLMGFQLTMQTVGLELVGIDPGLLSMDIGQLGIFKEQEMVTMSYASKVSVNSSPDEILFTLRFIAQKTGNIGDALSINSKITKAESYDGNLNIGDVQLSIRNVVDDQIILYQNEPNPFVHSTDISFYLPKAQQATITLNDGIGARIGVYQIDGVKGMNILQIGEEILGYTGVLYYTLDCGSFSETKKMIVIE